MKRSARTFSISTIRHCSSVARLSWPGSSYDSPTAFVAPGEPVRVGDDLGVVEARDERSGLWGQCDVGPVEHPWLDRVASGDVTGIEVGRGEGGQPRQRRSPVQLVGRRLGGVHAHRLLSIVVGRAWSSREGRSEGREHESSRRCCRRPGWRGRCGWRTAADVRHGGPVTTATGWTASRRPRCCRHRRGRRTC